MYADKSAADGRFLAGEARFICWISVFSAAISAGHQHMLLNINMVESPIFFISY
jgi:hypothetical protein